VGTRRAAATMTGYIVRRLLLLIPTILGVTFLVFILVRFVPGGAASALAGQDATPQKIKQINHALGLDQPIGVQYAKWLGGLLHLDFGKSITLTQNPITRDIKQRIGWTLELGGFAVLFSLLVGLPVGVLSAIRQDSLADYVARSIAIAALSVPSFWLATLLITYGSIGIPIGVPKLPPLVVIHYTPPLGREISAGISQNLRLILPAAIILGIGLSGSIMRLMRTQMLEVLRQDYIRTAQAKGLHGRVILMRHALRNSLIPVITIIGLQLPVIVGGSVVLESIFSLPGMGYYFLQALIQRDFTVIQAVTVIAAGVVVLSNLLVDLSYPLFDPRIRYS
jgi:peptide/nickel transport system permease protein